MMFHYSRIKGSRLKAHPDLSSAQVLNALVVIASAISAAKVTIICEWVEGSLCVPVYAIVDLDPADLEITQSLPYFAG